MRQSFSLAVWYCWGIGLVMVCIGTMFILGPEGASNIPKNNLREKVGKFLIATGLGIAIIGTLVFKGGK